MHLIVGLLCALLTWPALATAAFKVQPRLDLRTEYNDNLFLERNQGQGDQITILAPGLHLDYKASQLSLAADYSLLFKDYNKHSELDETRLRDVQRATLLADFFPGRDFTLHIADTLSRVSLDERRALGVENDFLNKSNLNDLRINPSYSFRKIQHFSATLGYLYDRKDYEVSEGDDSESHAGSLELNRDLTASLSLLAGTSQRFHRAERTEDYDRQDYYGGLRLRLSPRVSLHGRAGQARIQPDSGVDTQDLLISAGLDYDYAPKLRMSLAGGQDFTDSPTLGLYRNRYLNGTLAYQGKFSFDLSGQGQMGEYETINREDRSLGVRLDLGIPLSPRVNLGLGGDVTYYNFRPEDEVTYRYGGTLSLSYSYKVLFLRASYAHRVNDSTFAFNDYRNNIVAGEIGLHF